MGSSQGQQHPPCYQDLVRLISILEPSVVDLVPRVGSGVDHPRPHNATYVTVGPSPTSLSSWV